MSDTPRMDNLVYAFRIIAAAGRNPWEDLVEIIKVDDNIENAAKIAMITIIEDRYSDSYRRNAVLESKVRELFGTFPSAVWEDWGYPAELLPSINDLKPYIMTQLITYVMVQTGAIATNIGVLVSNPDNFNFTLDGQGGESGTSGTSGQSGISGISGA